MTLKRLLIAACAIALLWWWWTLARDLPTVPPGFIAQDKTILPMDVDRNYILAEQHDGLALTGQSGWFWDSKVDVCPP